MLADWKIYFSDSTNPPLLPKSGVASARNSFEAYDQTERQFMLEGTRGNLGGLDCAKPQLALFTGFADLHLLCTAT